MTFKNVYKKIKNSLFRLYMKPVHVLCFHHVTECFDEVSMKSCDWMPLNEFQSYIVDQEKRGVRFLSLDDAYNHIRNDVFRGVEYMAITFDDGYASLKEVIPWLMGKMIPVTLFINGKYLDGKSYRESSSELYLSTADLKAMKTMYGGLINYQSHGWEHVDARFLTAEQFNETLNHNIIFLSKLNNAPVRFHAFTWGRYSKENIKILNSSNIIPVALDGQKNWKEYGYVHREMIPLANGEP